MTTDLWVLVATAVFAALVPVVYAAGRLSSPGGNQWSFGNRDSSLAVPAWTDRAVRAHANLVENLPGFVILVLVAHVAGKSNAMTALGAEAFLAARIVYLALYTGGIIYLRTAAFFAGTAAQILILLQLFH